MIYAVRKKGLSVVECVVAISLLAVALTTLLSFQVLLTTRTKLAQQRLVAQQSLTNLAQRVTSAPEGEQVSQATIEKWAREMEQQHQFPPQTLQVEVQQVSEPAQGERVELVWQSGSKILPSYRLVAWRFSAHSKSDEGEQP